MHHPDASDPSAGAPSADTDSTTTLPEIAWQLRPELPLPALDAGLPDLTRLQMQLLHNRGVQGAAAARAYVSAAWQVQAPVLRGVPEAVQRLLRARDDRLAVTVYGDFDVDGMTSCAVMALGLRAVGIHANTHVPEREADGRGLNPTDVEQLADQGTRLIVTTDCGVSNVAEVARAHALGLGVIVTDHHPPHGEIALADVIVNPRHPDCSSDAATKDLAGVGVAFRVVEALLRTALGSAADAQLEALLDLVAVGTIGDVVPLTRENWGLVRAGLRRLREQPRPGLRALMRAASLAPEVMTERDISFVLAPRLNAANRMGQPRLALDLLLETDPAAARERAQQVHVLNAQRQELSDRLQAEARAQVERGLAQAPGDGAVLLVAQGTGWPLGIIGLVAGRLAEDYQRPALAVSVQGDECRGSMRGPGGCNLVQALAAHADLLTRYGGHAQAAGFTAPHVNLPALIAALRAELRAAQTRRDTRSPEPRQGERVAPDESTEIAVLAEEPEGVPTEPQRAPLQVDCRLPLRSAGHESYEALRALAPFGPGFPAPLFVAQGVRVARCWRSGPGLRTLRLVLRDGPHERQALWSRQGELWPLVGAVGRVDVVYRLELFTRPDAEPECVLRIEALRPTAG